MTTFLRKFRKAKEKKDSILSVGLDPALPRLRDDKTIPSDFLEGKKENKAKFEFCMDLVEKVSDFACAAKPNTQYVLDFTPEQHKTLNRTIHEKGMVSILDHKLGDIGATNQSGMFNIKELGYDALTFNPFSGNIKETMEFAEDYDLGIIVLTLMSNPEALHFMKKAKIQGKPGYVFISEKIREFGADGSVVGATGHVTLENIKKIRNAIGKEKLMFFPGVGAQGGTVEKVMDAGGENILIHVGRAIAYSEDPAEKAKYYNDFFNSFRE